LASFCAGPLPAIAGASACSIQTTAPKATQKTTKNRRSFIGDFPPAFRESLLNTL
jgi:hypothetical protein